MYKLYNFMRVDVFLFFGIMRDRVLVERDFVIFFEIFFFFVFFNRCRVMWEAGLLDGFEELFVLFIYSFRLFIWFKCFEKLLIV